MPYINFSVVSCSSEIPAVTRGNQWLPNNPIFGSVITGTCDKGYVISSGNFLRTCQENGNWSGSQPICTSN